MAVGSGESICDRACVNHPYDIKFRTAFFAQFCSKKSCDHGRIFFRFFSRYPFKVKTRFPATRSLKRIARNDTYSEIARNDT